MKYENNNYKQYEYDDQNRVVTTSAISGGAVTLTTRNGYDDNGNIISKLDKKGNDIIRHTRYEYDDHKRLIGFAESNSEMTGMPADKYIYSYDDMDRVTAISYPDKGSDDLKGIKFIYEEEGSKLLEIKAKVGLFDRLLRTYTYNNFGKISEMKDYYDFEGSNAAGYTLKEYSYDALDRVTAITYKDSSDQDTILEKYEYGYDKKGQIIDEKIINSYPQDEEDKVSEDRAFTYDSLDRLTGFSVTDNTVTQGGISTTGYTYDKIGNRLTKNDNGSMTSYQYDDLNRIKHTDTAEGRTAFAYDVNGNQLSEVGAGRNITNTYDALNQLEKTVIRDSSNNLVSETVNRYNGDGQRIRKAVTEGTATGQAVDITDYFYQDGVVSYTTDGSGDKTSHNLIGVEGNIISSKRYGEDAGYYSYNKDLQGSIMSVLDSSGAYRAGYSYTDFGETTKLGDQDFYNEVCYTGGIYDESTELYYLNARYYDPADGRFLNQDTYRGDRNEPQSLHLYSYCENDPINFVDPSGHSKKKRNDKHKRCLRHEWRKVVVKKSALKSVANKYKLSQVKTESDTAEDLLEAVAKNWGRAVYYAWYVRGKIWNKNCRDNAAKILNFYKKYKNKSRVKNALMSTQVQHNRRGNTHSYTPTGYLRITALYSA